MSAYFSGFAIGFSLILAIGAQNAFVLRQGIKQQHVFLVCLICASSDAILITLGVAGFASLINQFPWIEIGARYGGAIFLFWYGSKSFISALKSTDYLTPAENDRSSFKKTIITCLAFTWLNPHVYLDTVIFMGAISTQFTGMKDIFTLGAVSASFIFFFSLGYGAKLLIPLFKKAIAWRILDFSVGIIMFFLAFSFLFLLD